jgi:predicted cupin superfamily sugar epimerase
LLDARAQQLVATLGLKPHPEGGFFVETFRSAVKVATPRGERSACTAIYYLLPGDRFSPLHRVPGDETWCHYEGSAVELTILEGDAARTVQVSDTSHQAVVPGGAWQAAKALGNWALVGCIVAPGFDFQDFEMPSREELLVQLPAHRALVHALTRLK